MVTCRNPSLQRRAAQNLFEMGCWPLDGDSVYCLIGAIAIATVIANAPVAYCSGTFPGVCPYIAKSLAIHTRCFVGDEVQMRGLSQYQYSICKLGIFLLRTHLVWVNLQNVKVAVPYYSQGTFQKRCLPVHHL